jgi:hypothetical protein
MEHVENKHVTWSSIDPMYGLLELLVLLHSNFI